MSPALRGKEWHQVEAVSLPLTLGDAWKTWRAATRQGAREERTWTAQEQLC